MNFLEKIKLHILRSVTFFSTIVSFMKLETRRRWHIVFGTKSGQILGFTHSPSQQLPYHIPSRIRNAQPKAEHFRLWPKIRIVKLCHNRARRLHIYMLFPRPFLSFVSLFKFKERFNWTWLLPFGCATLYYMLDVQLFLHPQIIPYKEVTQLWKGFLRSQRLPRRERKSLSTSSVTTTNRVLHHCPVASLITMASQVWPIHSRPQWLTQGYYVSS
jgi:hypothetical protein